MTVAGDLRQRRVRPVPRILSTHLEGEAVLLDPEAGRYFSLNELGARVWELLGPDSDAGSGEGPDEGVARPLAAVHAVLAAEYEVDPERLWRDLEALVARLAEEGLVEVAPAEGG